MTAEPIPAPVQIVSVTARGEAPDGRVSIDVKLASQPDTPHGDRRLHRLHHELTSRVMRAVDARGIGSSADSVHVQVPRDGLEDAVRAIHRAVEDFNEVYPALLAEHLREVERIEAERAAEAERLRADQAVIDRVLDEMRRRNPNG